MPANPYDEFWAGLVQLVGNSGADYSEIELARVTAWPFVMAAAEEWVDIHTLVLHPGVRVHASPQLYALRSLILDRLNRLGLLSVYTWHDSVLLFETNDLPLNALLIGVQRVAVGVIVAIDDLTCHVHTVYGETLLIELVEAVYPGGFEVLRLIYVPDHAPAHRGLNTYNEIAFAVQLLAAQAPILMDTPGHPIRDWQTWHVGIDALEIVAICGDSAAPLAVMSHAVARVVHVWLTRWQLAQAVIRTWAIDYPTLNATADLLDDAVYFLQILQQHYPLEVPMRSLSTAEGALVATAMRDARAVWRQVYAQLKQVLETHKVPLGEG